MRLLARVVAHEHAATTCELDVAASALLADDRGEVPAWVALEWMAQCAAAHGSLTARAAGTPPLRGMLVGARRLTLARASFSPRERLQVTARPTGHAGELVTFDCEVRAAGEVVAAASLSVIVGNFAPQRRA
jgi:predicted hotdog family 3-hydroxylacyl-ACP dehydratase